MAGKNKYKKGLVSHQTFILNPVHNNIPN